MRDEIIDRAVAMVVHAMNNGIENALIIVSTKFKLTPGEVAKLESLLEFYGSVSED